jgi:hypothetical protein
VADVDSPVTARPPIVALLVVAVLGSLPLWAAATPAPAAASTRCDGVWVVVDAQGTGGGVTTRCAPGDPPTGLAALQGAGHHYTFVRPNMPMVCTIDGRPDPCNGAPGDAHWSYWHAQPGGSWTYASQGAGSRNPPPGSVEGWAFGAGEPPRTPPPAASAPEPTASPTPSPSASPSPSPTATAEPAPTATAEPAPAAPAEPSATPTTRPPGPAAATAPDDPPSASQATEQPDPAERAEPEAPVPDESGDPPTRTADTAPTAGPRTAADDRPTPTEASGRSLPPVELGDVDGEVAIGGPTDGDARAGLLAGGALAATIAGAGLFQARRRRRSFDP